MFIKVFLDLLISLSLVILFFTNLFKFLRSVKDFYSGGYRIYTGSLILFSSRGYRIYYEKFYENSESTDLKVIIEFPFFISRNHCFTKTYMYCCGNSDLIKSFSFDEVPEKFKGMKRFCLA